MGPKMMIVLLQRDLKPFALERDWRRSVRKKDQQWAEQARAPMGCASKADWNRLLRKNDPQSAVLQKDSSQAAVNQHRREVEQAPKRSLNSPP
jgi:hypothetical protein